MQAPHWDPTTHPLNKHTINTIKTATIHPRREMHTKEWESRIRNLNLSLINFSIFNYILDIYSLSLNISFHPSIVNIHHGKEQFWANLNRQTIWQRGPIADPHRWWHIWYGWPSQNVITVVTHGQTCPFLARITSGKSPSFAISNSVTSKPVNVEPPRFANCSPKCLVTAPKSTMPVWGDQIAIFPCTIECTIACRHQPCNGARIPLCEIRRSTQYLCIHSWLLVRTAPATTTHILNMGKNIAFSLSTSKSSTATISFPHFLYGKLCLSR